MPGKLDKARKAKKALAERLRADPSVVGIGLAVLGAGGAVGVKVNLSEASGAKAKRPATVLGVPVTYEVVGRVAKRGGA